MDVGGGSVRHNSMALPSLEQLGVDTKRSMKKTERGDYDCLSENDFL